MTETLLNQIDRLNEYLHLESDINKKDFKYIDTMLQSIRNEAIKYSRCCESSRELLKDKENLSFKGWMRTKGYEKNDNEPWLKDNKICTDSEIRYMLEQYKTLQMLHNG